jgi:F-type H+-transporting ATPase subunit b
MLLNLATAMAEEHEGAAHEASIFDLKFPVLNFVVLVGFLVWKMKKPLSDMFSKKVEEIKSLMDSAEKQNRDAQEKLNSLETKIKNIDSELVKINADYETDVVSFLKNNELEVSSTIARMQRDVQNKIDGEKKELLDELSHEILNKVVMGAQSTIKANTELKNKATNNIIAGLK